MNDQDRSEHSSRRKHRRWLMFALAVGWVGVGINMVITHGAWWVTAAFFLLAAATIVIEVWGPDWLKTP